MWAAAPGTLPIMFSRKCYKIFWSTYYTCQQKLLQEIILEKISLVSWYITIFRVVTTLLEENLSQMHQKLNQLERHSYVLIISKIPCSAIQKIVCPSYLFCNFHKRGLLELWKKFTDWVVNAAIEFSRFYQTDTTGPNEIVLITGNRTAEFH